MSTPFYLQLHETVLFGFANYWQCKVIKKDIWRHLLQIKLPVSIDIQIYLVSINYLINFQDFILSNINVHPNFVKVHYRMTIHLSV